MELRVFVGLQFTSVHYSKMLLDGYVDEAVRQLNNELALRLPARNVRAVYEVVDITSGKNVTDYVTDRIRKAHICVFELSDRNPNVMFELGMAYAQQKKIALVVNEGADWRSLPSDLQGLFVRTYNNDTLRTALGEEIYGKTMAFIDEAKDLQSVFDLENAAKVNIICPEIPTEFRTRYAAHRFTKDYIDMGRFGDPDALELIASHVTRVFPQVQVDRCVCSEAPSDCFGHPMICIGGPGWNSVTMDLLHNFKVPLHYGDFSEGVEDFRITNTLTGKTYQTEILPSHRIASDIGVFAKLPGAAGSNRPIYLVNGIQTFGVLGTARSFVDEQSRHRNMQVIRAAAGNRPDFFVAVLRLPIVEGRVHPANVAVEDLMFYSPDSRHFEPAGA